jgi:hypothetical protein
VKGLAVAGRRVVMPAEPDQRGATYAVSARISRVDATFEVRMVLQRTSDGQALNRQENHCDVSDCSVAELARRSARELVRQTLGRASEDHRQPDPIPPGLPAVAAPTPPAVQATPEPLPPASVEHRWVWPALAGVSAVAIAAGAGLIAVDQTSVPGASGKQFDHGLAWGLAAIGAGVALGGVSTYYIFKESAEQSPQVALRIGPGSLSLAGRF